MPEQKWPFKKMMNGHLAVTIDKFKYSGKLIIPDTAQGKPTKGRVIMVGEDILDIQEGDKILYSQFAGYMLKFEDTPVMRILGYSEVLAILNEDSPEVEGEGA
jgi:co-chaperonin GroES (HSP10)